MKPHLVKGGWLDARDETSERRGVAGPRASGKFRVLQLRVCSFLGSSHVTIKPHRLHRTFNILYVKYYFVLWSKCSHWNGRILGRNQSGTLAISALHCRFRCRSICAWATRASANSSTASAHPRDISDHGSLNLHWACCNFCKLLLSYVLLFLQDGTCLHASKLPPTKPWRICIERTNSPRPAAQTIHRACRKHKRLIDHDKPFPVRKVLSFWVRWKNVTSLGTKTWYCF